MDMRRLVGMNVRRARLAMRLTQEDLAARTGRTQQYISGLEAGRRNPTIIVIYEFAVALGTTPALLVTPAEPVA